MENYGAMIRNVFELGSVLDAENLFEAIVKNAVPTNDFRRLELIRFVKDEKYLEGRSWNHVFQIKATAIFLLNFQRHPHQKSKIERITKPSPFFNLA